MSTSSGNDPPPSDADASGKYAGRESPATATTPPGTMVKSSRTRTQGVRLLSLVVKSGKIALMLLAVWLVGYFGFSVSWVLIALFVYIIGDEYMKVKESRKTYVIHAVQNEQGAILARVDELPSWVYFPDVERAEWLNKMIQQMWPFIGEYVKAFLKTSVESTINSNMPNALKPFRFQKIHLGSIPPRIGGVKVYIDKVKRDEILLDVELTYASDADITVSVRGLNAGVKDILVQGALRVIMRPLVSQVPIVGGLCVFFLNQPKIDFDLTEIANILDMPLLSTSLRTIVSDLIANFLVLPNKLPIPLIDSISITELKYPMPVGAIRLTVVEASDLKKADVGVFSKGKSDPYCKIYAGGYSYKTSVIQNSVSPVWNETFEIVVDQKHGQVLDIDVLDEDPGEDDELGSAFVDVEQLSTSKTFDAWLQLENVQTGTLHLKAIWLYLSNDPADIYKAKTSRGNDNHLSTALLIVTVDSAKDLMAGKRTVLEPSAFVRLEVGNREEKTQVKQKTANPRWEESFRFLVVDPELQDLTLEVFDTNKNDKRLGICKIPLHHLMTSNDLTLSRPFPLKEADTECTITLRLVLRLLTPIEPKDHSNEAEKPKVMNVESKAEVQKSASAVKTAQISTGSKSSALVDDQKFKLESHSDSISNNVFDQGDGNVLRYRGLSVPSDGRFGRIQVTIRYSTQRSRLVVVVHQCENLIPCDDDNLSDPYVRLCLMPDKSSKKKTQIQKNSLNPVFDETFDWPISKNEAATRTLELSVKNTVGLFSKNRIYMGYAQLNLSEMEDLSKAVTEWYDLQDPDAFLKDSSNALQQ